MGLFTRKAKDKAKELEQQEMIPRPTYTLEQEIIAKEATIDAQVASTSTLNNIKWNKWIQINLWANYFANRFTYITKNPIHNKFINKTLRHGFIYGKVGVWYNNGTPELIHVLEEKEHKYRVVINEENNNFFYKEMKRDRAIEVWKGDVIFYQFDSLNLPAITLLQPVLKFEELVQKVLYNETLTNATRIMRDVSPGTSNKTAQQFMNFDSPIINRIEGGQDKYQGLTLETNSEKVLDTIEYAKNWYYDILGRRTNSDFKKTHSLNSEIEAGQFNAQVLEKDRHLYLWDFLRDYSYLFNIQIDLEMLNGNIQNVRDLNIKIKEVDNETKPSHG